MKKSTGWVAAGLSMAGLFSIPAKAVTWNLVGTSSVSSNSATWRDHKRIAFASIVADSDNSATANIYAAFQTGNGISTSPNDFKGWLTIFKPNGVGGYTQLDVDLTTADVPGSNIYCGPITKMVVGGDHTVYALQNWMQISFGLGNPSHVNRIIQIDSNGTIVEIKNAGLMNGTNDSMKHWNGITVGGDGNVYFDSGGRMSGDPINDKFHYIWRYNVTSHLVEESPQNGTINNGESGQGDGAGTGIAGKQLFNLEYVGTRNTIDSFTAMYTDQPWTVKPIGWDKISTFVGASFYTRRSAVNGAAPSAGSRDWVTAMAYDPGTKRFWVGGRAVQATSPQDQPWQNKDGNTSVIDLGGNNYAMKSTKQASKFNSWFYTQHGDPPYNNFFNGNGSSVTIAASVRIESMDAGYSSFIMHAAANTTQASSPTPVVGIKVDNGVYKLWDIAGNVQLGDDTTLGSVTLNNFEQFTLFVDATNDTIKCWHGNALVYNNTTANTETANVGELAFGSATTRSTAQTQLAVLTADWVGVGPGEIAPPYGTSPTREDNWPHAGPLTTAGNYMGVFLPGHCLPENFVTVSTMTRWAGTGSDASNSLFTGAGCPVGGCAGMEPNNNPDPMPGIVNRAEFAANGNTPFLSNRTNGGKYWVSALAVNPCDGNAWVAYGAKSAPTDEGSFYQSVGSDGLTRFGKDHLGNVYAIDPQGDQSFSLDQGAPLSTDNSEVAALAFTKDKSKVFAAVVDFSVASGPLFKVYSANNPGACCPAIGPDVEPGTFGVGSPIGNGFVDMNDFATFQTCYQSGAATGKCKCLDFNNNNVVDDADLIKFLQCTPIGGHGAGVPATPGCSN